MREGMALKGCYPSQFEVQVQTMPGVLWKALFSNKITTKLRAWMAKKDIATNVNPFTSTKLELVTYISSLPDYLHSMATHDSFKVLKLFADLNQRWYVKEWLSKDAIPHSLRLKFKLTSSQATKDLPESTALVECTKNTLFTFHEAKTIIQEINHLEILQAEKAVYKAVLDTIAHLAAAYKAFYKYSTAPGTEETHKYQLFNAICHRDFDIIFANYLLESSHDGCLLFL